MLIMLIDVNYNFKPIQLSYSAEYQSVSQAGIYLFNVNNRDIRAITLTSF